MAINQMDTEKQQPVFWKNWLLNYEINNKRCHLVATFYKKRQQQQLINFPQIVAPYHVPENTRFFNMQKAQKFLKISLDFP